MTVVAYVADVAAVADAYGPREAVPRSPNCLLVAAVHKSAGHMLG